MSLSVTKGISGDGKTIYAIDSTGAAYGDTLPARNTLAVLPYALKTLSTGDVEVDFDAYDPEVETNFAVDVEDADSVYRLYLFAVVKWTSGGLNEGDIVFDLNDRLLKKYISGVLTEITIASLIDEVTVESGDVYSLVVTALTIKRDVLELAKLSKLEEYLNDECEYNELVEITTKYDYVRTLRAAAFIEFAKPSYSVAQLKIETGNSFADSVIEVLTQEAA